MAFKTSHAIALCAAVLASGCSFAEDALFPSLSGGNPATSTSTSTSSALPPPVLGTSTFEPVSVTPGQATGTYVGQKVTSLRGDLQQLQQTLARQDAALQQLRGETAADSQRYHGTVAAINARLQVGSTPGNPVLMQQWNAAQAELDKISEDVIKMNRLATEVAATSSMAAFLLDSVSAARGLSGAVEDDHRQLAVLSDETQRTVVTIDRLLTELSQDISRQQQYVGNEKSDLNTLAVAIKNGQLFGAGLASRMNAGPLMAAPAAASGYRAGAETDALMVIRFNRPNVQYENALYSAIKGALDRRPTATFEVVAVSPGGAGSAGQAALGATSARRNAEAVVRSLTSMGLPADRIRLSATNSGAAQSGEVHVFVR